MTIERVDCWVFRAPIDAPVRSSFGEMNDRPALLMRIEAADGAWGWGEVFCNFPQVGAEHRARLIDSLFVPLLVGQPSDDAARLGLDLGRRLHNITLQCGEEGPFAQVMGAVDQALWDMAARRRGIPLWRLVGGDGTDKNTTRVYASGLGPTNVVATARAQQARGFTAFKFKVGFGAKIDEANFTDLREAVGDDVTIMIDANQAWGLDEARAQMERLATFRPAWVEEPLAADCSLDSWSTLSSSMSIPLAAGENVRGLQAFENQLANRHLTFVQPDVGKWGGITGALAVAQLAREHHATLCPHWLGGGVGLAASLHLRAGLGTDGYVEVDSNPNPLRDEIFELPTPRDGWIKLSEQPGIGIDPDLDRLARFVRNHRY